MDKVFLLLRNNQQRGPLSLTELVQLGLQPTDLIWVEGKSSCWSFPAEIEALAPYVALKKTNNGNAANREQNLHSNPQPDLSKNISPQPAPISHQPTPSHPHVFVSMPGAAASKPPIPVEKTLEQKADELKRKVEAYTLEHAKTGTAHNEASYKPRSLNELKEEYDTWFQQQHDHHKKRSYKRTGVTTLITILVLGIGYVLAKDTLLSKRAATAGFAVKNELHSEGAKSAKKSHVRKEVVPQKDTSLLITDSALIAEQAINESTALNKKKMGHSPRAASVTIPVPAVTDMAKAEPSSMPPLPPPVEENKAAAEDSALSQKTSENRNTLGKKISRFFNRLGKKKREKEAETSGTGVSPSTTTTITLIPVNNAASNDPAYKVTLYNRAATTLTNAVVELRYYSDKNDLLEKRLIHFASVPAKATAALTVPGNRSAHRTSYQLIAVDD